MPVLLGMLLISPLQKRNHADILARMNPSTPFSHLARRFKLWYLVLFLPFLCCSAFGITRWWHDVQLRTFANNVFSYPLPPQTDVISQETHFGALIGSHNHCDYAAIRHLETHLSAAEIRAFYQNAFVPSIEGLPKRVPIEVNISQERSSAGIFRFSIQAIDYDQPKGLELRAYAL